MASPWSRTLPFYFMYALYSVKIKKNDKVSELQRENEKLQQELKQKQVDFEDLATKKNELQEFIRTMKADLTQVGDLKQANNKMFGDFKRAYNDKLATLKHNSMIPLSLSTFLQQN